MSKSYIKKMLFSGGTFILFVGLFGLCSCEKTSNSLKPYSDEIKFSQTLSYNGTAVLLADIQQNIEIGPDSLLLTLRNPLSQELSNIEILYFIQTGDKFDDVMTYFSVFTISNLAPLQDTVIKILSHPELPIASENFKLVILNTSNFNVNPLAGYYNGQAGYFMDADTIPTAFSFVKGYISADGTVNLWSKLNADNKKLSGQFIDTTALNALYMPKVEETLSMTASVQPDSLNNLFLIDLNMLQFTIVLTPTQTNLENKIKLTLYK